MSERNIVESELFAAQCKEISADTRKMDDILDAVTWALHENAEQFFQVIPNRNLWLVKTDPFPDAPALRIWFSLTPDMVELLSIERIGQGPPIKVKVRRPRAPSGGAPRSSRQRKP